MPPKNPKQRGLQAIRGFLDFLLYGPFSLLLVSGTYLNETLMMGVEVISEDRERKCVCTAPLPHQKALPLLVSPAERQN